MMASDQEIQEMNSKLATYNQAQGGSFGEYVFMRECQKRGIASKNG
jgi:hypothetical protein